MVGHCHHTICCEPAYIVWGVRFPFFVGCHCRASAGWRCASELLVTTCFPAHIGHPRWREVRLAREACQMWSGSLGHCHQTFRSEPATTCSGVSEPFLVECHWAAMSGKSVASEFVFDTCLPAQAGQPLPRVLSLIFTLQI